MIRVLVAHKYTVSRKWYYRMRSSLRVTEAVVEKAHIMNSLFDLYVANRRVYGARKMWHAARRAGLQVGRDQVARLMGLMGLSGVTRARRKPKATGPALPPGERSPDLMHRQWKAVKTTDVAWIADFTYCH